MAIKTIRPQYKISYVLDDDLQVSQVAGAYLPEPKQPQPRQQHSLRNQTFTLGSNTYRWMDIDGKHCVNVDYA